jgi:GTP-binding protein Era
MAHKAGFVNLIGRPNVGKSTLMNKLVGERLSIINKKAQTTRHRILGIVNDDDYQIVYSDTPGILEPKYELQSRMMAFVKDALKDADILVLIVDAKDKKADYFNFQKAIQGVKAPLFIALNKIDLISQDELEERIEQLERDHKPKEIFPISALNDFGIDQLQRKIVEYLPENPPYFDKDALTDRNMRFFVSEIIRERILENYQKEIPYSVQVEVESYKDEEKIVRISAVIYVERKTQKGIIIGHRGAAIKKVGIESRKRIEEFIDKQVFLEMYVKVDEDWRTKERRLKAFGYK